MAFQDGAGGIIIDAVLTDLGRQKMAQGKFKVSKFALGDDEVNYAFISASSGTAEIPLSDLPPILEAFGNEHANINYGLLSLPRPDVLYIPQLKVNDKVDASTTAHTDDFYYLAVNKETARKIETDIGSSKYILENNQIDKNKLLIESGIDVPATGDFTSDLEPTEHNKKGYILNMGLYDKYFLVYTDSKYVDSLLRSPNDSLFENDSIDNLYMNMGPLQRTVKTSLPKVIDMYECYRIEAVDQSVFKNSAATGDVHSAFNGPRGTILALNLKVKDKLSPDSQSPADFRYTKFGSTNTNVLGGTNLYDFIDTTIYVQGLSSNSRLQIPIRIIRFAGTT